ncbi:MAG: MFS transporter [Xanthomonadales bacterium]|nr:MFS transporter [Xanthomonadales bacterium]
MNASESIYELLTDDNEGRLCEDIPEESCRETPRNFVFILLSQCLTKLGDALASPKTTLAWLVTAVGAPGWVLGYLVPLRESGSMVPQLILGGRIRRLPVRKWVCVVSNVLQGACVAGLAWIALALSGRTAGWAILGLVAAFSLARSLSSIASKDVVGKTIPKRRRGQLSGWAASVSGFLAVTAGFALSRVDGSQWDGGVLALLLLVAAGLWFLGAVAYAVVSEEPGETAGGRSLGESIGSLRLLVSDRDFRRFVVARALLMCSALSAPFYVALSQGSEDGSGLAALGGFVIASGLASLVSGPVWGRFADRSSRLVMATAAAVAVAIGAVTVAAAWFLPQVLGTLWFLPAAYFILSIAHEGVRVGRKTYVVNLGKGNQRTDYVAISNTVIGVLLLVVGSVGFLTPLVGTAGVIGLLALMGAAGVFMSWSLKEV